MSALAPTPDDPDLYLVRQIRNGDQRAWRQLIDRYEGRLLAFARSRLNDPADAEDALQETLMGFVSSLKHFDEERSLETYLFTILRYKIQEALTKKNRKADLAFGFDPDDDSAPSHEPADSETPSRIAARQEASRQAEKWIAASLRHLINELRDRDKLDDLQVVELLFFVGLRNKEAAEKLGREEKHVAGVKFRALARLQEFLRQAASDGRFDPAAIPLDGLLSDDNTISQIWRRHRLSCLKRTTIGSYLLGALEAHWENYTRFHLETVACLTCRANRDDLAQPESEALRPGRREELFASSVGFLSGASNASTRG